MHSCLCAYMCGHGLYGAYKYNGIVLQIFMFHTMSVSVCRIHVEVLTAGFKDEESYVVRHVKPPRCGEAFNKPRALSGGRNHAIGALAHGFSR